MKELPKNQYCYSPDRDPFEDRLREISYADKAGSKGKKVVLVVPPSPQVPTPGREFLVTGPFEGFTYMATLVKKMGYDLTVIDCRLQDDPVKLVLDGINDAQAVGFGAFCDSYVFLRDATKKTKEVYPEKMLFLGGPLMSSLPEVMLNNTSADCGVMGEGELTLIEFLESYLDAGNMDLSGIKGMAYTSGDEVKVNPPRPQIKDLDNLPLLDYTIWPNYQSILENGQILISSMRGCPQECSFCFKTIPALRFKSIERFEEEVVYLKKTTGFNYTWLNDLTFNAVEEKAIEVCKVLHKHEVRYHCFARVHNVSKKLIDTLKATGCLGIWYGIESYDQDILDLNRKDITIEEINSAVKLAEDAGLLARGLFIVGLYGETEESLKKMLEYIKKSSFLPLVKYLVPFPGTAIFDYAVKNGQITDIVGFLEMLSRRKIRDYDDEIINITDLPEGVIRKYFHEIWKLTEEKQKKFREDGIEC